jgi:cysteine desulfurase
MIYLDYAATTPVDKTILTEVLPFFEQQFGNASSVHQLGRQARLAVEEARETVAYCLNAPSAECIFFTSGATESNNWALHHAQKGILTATTEHEAVLEVVHGKRNLRNSWLNPDTSGKISVEMLANTPLTDIDLLSLMWVNNETGVVQDVKAIANFAQKHHLLYHCDATQAVALYETNLSEWQVDFLSFSGHKLYGLKGAGVLYISPNVAETQPFILGGAQERRNRGGTENVAAIVALSLALQQATTERAQRLQHYKTLKTALIDLLYTKLSGEFVLNGNPENEVPIVNISFPAQNGKPLDGEMLLLNMDLAGICLSAGSACTSGAVEPSHVLLAMGIPHDTAQATLRFSIGKDSTLVEIENAVDKLVPIIQRMRR